MEGALVCFECSQCAQTIVCNASNINNWIISGAGNFILHLKSDHPRFFFHLAQEDDTLTPISKYKLVTNWLLPKDDTFYDSFPAKEAYIWSSSQLTKDLKKILEVSDELYIQIGDFYEFAQEAVLEAISYFVIIKCFDNVPVHSIQHLNVKVNDEIISQSTPFNCITLFNTWSMGSVSNVISEHLCIAAINILNDCAGCPIFLLKDGKKGSFFGLLLCNLLHETGGYTGFSFIALFPANFKSKLKSHLFQIEYPLTNSTPSTSSLQRRIVGVKVDGSWGSGIIISRDGLILICAHQVFFGENLGKIFVIEDRNIYTCKLVFCTRREAPSELAILKIEDENFKNGSLEPIPISTRCLTLGEKVNAVGYGPFLNCNGPMVTPGIVSRVTKNFLCTTCNIHPGASGGALTDSSGNLVGILTFNLGKKHDIFPFLNFTIPASSFGSSVLDYIKNRDTSVLSQWIKSVPNGALELKSRIMMKKWSKL